MVKYHKRYNNIYQGSENEEAQKEADAKDIQQDDDTSRSVRDRSLLY